MIKSCYLSRAREVSLIGVFVNRFAIIYPSNAEMPPFYEKIYIQKDHSPRARGVPLYIENDK